MKLRITCTNPFGPKFACTDEEDPSVTGTGDTAEAAKDDFMDRFLQREVSRDIANGIAHAQSWDAMIRKLFVVKS
jgi:hypothetical protein